MTGIDPQIVAHIKQGDGHVKTPQEGSVARRGYPMKRTKSYQLQTAQRRLRMAAMCADGASLRAIAAEENVSHNYVADEINALIADLNQQALETLNVKVAREIAVINMVQLEATIAFYESKEGKITNMHRRKKEVRSAFVNTNSRAKFNTVKSPEALGMTALGVQQKTRSTIASLFAETPPLEPDFEPQAQQQAPSGVIQLPVESEEEYERIEMSAGQREWLTVILECVEKRCRIQGLYKEGEEGYNSAVTLTPDQRKARLTALAQDIRAARVIAERESGRELPPAHQDYIPARGDDIEVTAVPVPSNGNGEGPA